MALIERRIDKLGRIVLPMDFRKALGLEGEADVVLDICGNTIVIKGADNACRLCGSNEEVSELKVCSSCVRKIKKSNILFWEH